MLKSLLLAMAVALMATTAHVAHAAGNDDVFLDEGDGDFDSIPVPSASAPAAPTGKAPKAAKSAPPADEPSVSTLVDEALTEDAPATMPEAMPETMPEAAPAPKEKPAKKVSKAQKTAKVKKASAGGKGMFLTTRDACPMMREPASEGSPMITVKPAKRIWVEEVDGTWVRGFNKAGEPGYISRDCFE